MANNPNYSYIPYQVLDTDGSSLRSTLMRYARQWPWFLLSVGLVLAGAYVYLLYQAPTYTSKASLLIKDEKKGLDTDNMMKELEIFAPKKIMENETEILKSYTLMGRVVDQLHLNIAYFQETSFGMREVYQKSPIWLVIESPTPALYQAEDPIKITFDNAQTVRIDGHAYPVNASVQTIYGRMRVFPRVQVNAETEPVFVRVATPTETVTNVLRVLKAEPTSKASTVIALSIETPVPDKGEVILNKLIDEYNQAAVNDKNRVASNTLTFIEDRLKLVARELETVEKNVERYKSAQGITDLSTQAKSFLETVQRNDSELGGVSVQLAALGELEDYLKSQPGNRNGAPATVGLNDPTLLKLIQEANALEAQRTELLQTVPEQNPLVRALDEQIKSVKVSISDNVRTMRMMLTTAKEQFSSTNQEIENAIKAIPVKERVLMNISRQQAIKNDLYTYLLTKREETAVSYAATISDSRIVDAARSDAKPVKPNKPLIYVLFGLLGLLFPVGVMAGRDAINNRVIRRSEVEETTQAPILGEIIRKRQPESLVVSDRENSVIAEQIRSLRTNLNFLRNRDEKSQVLLFTSSINGEGKSFLSLNLGASLGLMNARTVILEMDLRKPKLRDSLNFTNSAGLSNYLIGESTIDEIVRPINDNYFIIPSGPIPPNPSELLGSPRLAQLIAELRERYDYVVIDAPPIGLVTDAQLIAPFADTTLYIVRHNVTPKQYLKMIDMLYRERRFPNLNVILNAVGEGEANYYSYLSKNTYVYGKQEKKQSMFKLRP
ncbi:MAG: polysaccharide biosynthesis tyrosine autokinase [Cytophagales bacterium]|nr:MAG: polysaccharide biosynthesis tyrosine autokinase [Cytophagales bacterium]